VVLWGIFMVGPVLGSLATSFTDLRSVDLRHPLSVNLVGLHNSIRLFRDESFRQSAFVTAHFVLVGVPLTMVLALAVAVALNRGVTRLRSLFRVGYYLPVVTSVVAIAMVWRFLLQPDSGVVNDLLRRWASTAPTGSTIRCWPCRR
jgi:multiple sugar transport system permease protein